MSGSCLATKARTRTAEGKIFRTTRFHLYRALSPNPIMFKPRILLRAQASCLRKEILSACVGSLVVSPNWGFCSVLGSSTRRCFNDALWASQRVFIKILEEKVIKLGTWYLCNVGIKMGGKWKTNQRD